MAKEWSNVWFSGLMEDATWEEKGELTEDFPQLFHGAAFELTAQNEGANDLKVSGLEPYMPHEDMGKLNGAGFDTLDEPSPLNRPKRVTKEPYWAKDYL